MGEAAARPDLLPGLRDQRRESLDRIVAVLYQELREIAHRHLLVRGRGSTLQTTALLHEAYLKLVDQSRAEWTDQVHFLALAAVAMRHVLVDRARERVALKRGGGHAPITLGDESSVISEDAAGLLELNDALERLATLDARLAQVVECRFFGGMSEAEIAAALHVTVRTVQRDWLKARMLLRDSLGA
jgi:RNA polymerase sigma factor (TIGR02999 family)